MKKYLLLISLCLASWSCQASYNQGGDAYAEGDYQSALKAWKAVAEQTGRRTNIADAQYGLGLLYWQGKGVVQNYHEAEKWLGLAANNGHSEAQLKLAYLYLTGINEAVNVAKAIKWFERSAQQGNVDAQYNLGLLYFKGLGGSQNLVLARKWLTFAAQQGVSSAKELLAKMDLPAAQAIPKQSQTGSVAKQVLSSQVTANAKPAVTTAPPVAGSNASEAERPAVSSPMFMKGYYTIQLLASDEQNDVLKAMEKWRNSLSSLLVTDKMKKSKRIFILGYGKYSSVVEATQAIAKLPNELRESKPWVFKMQKDVFPLSVKQSDTTHSLEMQPVVALGEKNIASSNQVVDFKEEVNSANESTVNPSEQVSDEQIIASNKQAVMSSALPVIDTSFIQSLDASTVQPPAPMDVYYSIQLLSSVKQNEAEQFVEKWRNYLDPLIISDKIKQFKRIFVVVYGKYPSAIAAKQAIDDLPPELKKNKPWSVKMRGNTLAP